MVVAKRCGNSRRTSAVGVAQGGEALKQVDENCDPVFDNEVGESSATRLIADAIVRKHFHLEIAWKGTPVDFARICAVASTVAAMLFLLAVTVGLIAP